MEFLVHIDIDLPPDLPDSETTRLYEAEETRAAELAKTGTLVRLWRIPGRRANIGLWSADNATELHAALSSLPLWPYMDIAVDPLAKHPSDPAPAEDDPTGDGEHGSPWSTSRAGSRLTNSS